MIGNIKEIRKFDDGHAIILYDNINTSEGQSGAPLYLQIAKDKWTIIGVHVGYDPIT
jgi:V8-like Glu-specific endopeptidase